MSDESSTETYLPPTIPPRMLESTTQNQKLTYQHAPLYSSIRTGPQYSRQTTMTDAVCVYPVCSESDVVSESELGEDCGALEAESGGGVDALKSELGGGVGALESELGGGVLEGESELGGGVGATESEIETEAEMDTASEGDELGGGLSDGC